MHKGIGKKTAELDLLQQLSSRLAADPTYPTNPALVTETSKNLKKNISGLDCQVKIH